MFLFLYLTAGVLTNLYYLISKGDEYTKMLESGEIKALNIFGGVILTQFLWPISIYNNEFRKK